MSLREEIEHIIEFGGTYTDAQGVPSNIKDADEIISKILDAAIEAMDVFDALDSRMSKRIAIEAIQALKEGKE